MAILGRTGFLMELYGSRACLARSEADYYRLPVGARGQSALALAWQLRQRDPQRAFALAREALASSDVSLGDSNEALRCHARVTLLKAEIEWLEARLARADDMLTQALQMFDTLQDACGAGDARLLASRLAHDRGDVEQRTTALDEALACYQRSGDTARVLVCRAWKMHDESFNGRLDGEHVINDALMGLPDDKRPAGAGLALFAQAQIAFMTGDYSHAIAGFESAARELDDAGMVRQSVAATLNVAAALGNLNEFDGQAQIVARALEQVRARAWPVMMGGCLYNLGDVHQGLGRLADARSAFTEACHWLANLRHSRVYVVSGTFLGETCRRLGLIDEALAAFQDARETAKSGGHDVLLPRILVGEAACLSQLDRASEALQLAQQVLRISAGRDLVTERMALLGLARIHAQHRLDPPPDMRAPTASLHYLERLWTLQSGNPDWTPDDELLGELAVAWEQAGDLAAALRFERMRLDALARASVRRAGQLAAATQARHEAETAILEAEHQRRIARFERERLAVLEDLSRAGQEITASLDSEAVFRAIDRHVSAMLETTSAIIWLLQGGQLVPSSSQDNTYRAATIAVGHEHSLAAHCARERGELVVRVDDVIASGDVGQAVPAAVARGTALYAPLQAGERLLGVMSVWSGAEEVLGEREKLIFRNICAYGAIALGNAANYHEVMLTNRRLLDVQAELERLVRIDPLTSLYNRRHLMQAAESEIGRAVRSGWQLSVMMIDLDHFKNTNDTYGHAVGDEALVVIAEVLRQTLRGSDIVARFGGEEFVALMPDTPLETALAIAERVREAIAATSIQATDSSFVQTVSIGVTSWFASETSIEQALRRADTALYRAKADGRNRVSMCVEARHASPPSRLNKTLQTDI